MVGATRGPGRGDAELRSGIRPAYEASAGRWARGPERVYASLARALLAGAAARLDGGWPAAGCWTPARAPGRPGGRRWRPGPGKW